MDAPTAALAEALGRLHLQNRAVEILSLVARHIHDAVALLDERGRVEWANEAFIHGGAMNPPLPMEPTAALDVAGMMAAPETARAIQAALASHRTVTGKKPRVFPDGRFGWTRFHLSPLVDDTGGFSRFILIEADAPHGAPAARETEHAGGDFAHERDPLAHLFQDPIAARDVWPARPAPTNGGPNAAPENPAAGKESGATPESVSVDRRASPSGPRVAARYSSGASLVNLEAAVSRLEGNVDLLRELIRMFLDDHRNLMDEIERAIRNRAADDLARYAHRLKDLAANFDATALVQTAFALENMGRNRDLDRAPGALRTLRNRILPVTEALTAYIHETGHNV